jgi:hypothetical protein
MVLSTRHDPLDRWVISFTFWFGSSVWSVSVLIMVLPILLCAAVHVPARSYQMESTL